jgi:hypothetical protein
MSDKEERQKAIAHKIVRYASADERDALGRWAEGLLSIRGSNLSVIKKASEAIRLTKDNKAVASIVKREWSKLKRVGWDERSWKARLGMGATVATVAIVGNAGAGIAALGTAIGVPLWIVAGAGGTFAGLIVDEVKSESGKLKTTYTEIDAEKKVGRKS